VDSAGRFSFALDQDFGADEMTADKEPAFGETEVFTNIAAHRLSFEGK